MNELRGIYNMRELIRELIYRGQSEDMKPFLKHIAKAFI